jgi:dihydroorotate dehydrogenase
MACSASTPFGRDLPGPLGLAAGFDEDAKGPDALLVLGFGFVEIGTVTAEAQPGNPTPRMFRLPRDRALVNRMGFNNDGATAAARRLALSTNDYSRSMWTSLSGGVSTPSSHQARQAPLQPAWRLRVDPRLRGGHGSRHHGAWSRTSRTVRSGVPIRSS